MILCSKCGALQIHAGTSSFCETCGSSFEPQSEDERGKTFLQNTIPWENQNQHPLPLAFYQTVYLCLCRPSQFFNRITVKTSLFQAWLFGLVCGSLGMVFTLLWGNTAFYAMNIFTLSNVSAGNGSISAFSLILSPILISLTIFAISIYIHFMLVATRSCHAGFRSTVIAVCYMQSALLFCVLPVIGNTLYLIMSVVLAIYSMSMVHNISKSRAVFALLFPCFVFLFLALIIVISAMSSLVVIDSFLKQILPSLY